MKDKVVNFLRAAFPYLAVVALWRMSSPFWNPGGILALIPIFYCTFVRPTPWFGLYGAVFSFLIDYQFDTVLYWTTMYCILYAINGFQTFIDLTKVDKNAFDIFMIFWTTVVLICALMHPSFINIIRAIWIIAWGGALYIPITETIRRIHHD